MTFFHFFHKRLRIFNQFFTHLLYVPVFARGEVGSLLIILLHCTVPTEYVGERIVKIGQHLAKTWTGV